MKNDRLTRNILALFVISLVCPILMSAQTENQRPVTTVFAVLLKSLDSRSATVGQELDLRTINDIVVGAKVIIPRDSKLVGHLTQVSSKRKDGVQSALAVVVDKAARNDGVEISLQAVIAAVAAPRDNSLASDPAYGMMHSNEPTMVGSRPSTTASAGELSPGSKASSNAAVATANLKGAMDQPLWLNESSQGAIGYEGLSLSWILIAPPPVTVFASKSKNVKLEAGTQVLLRMAPPRTAQ